MKRTLVVFIAALALLGGCGDGDLKATSNAPSSASLSCAEGDVDRELSQAIGTGKLGDGSAVVSSQQVSSTSDRAKIDVVFRICGNSGSTGDALKSIATQIAAKLEASSLGDKVASMRVTNLSGGDNPSARVRCEAFQNWNFTGGLAGTERAPWKTSDEK